MNNVIFLKSKVKKESEHFCINGNSLFLGVDL